MSMKNVAELQDILGKVQNGTVDPGTMVQVAEFLAHSAPKVPPLNVAKTRKLLASFGAADQITPAHMDELLALCSKEMYMLPLFEHLQAPQYCLKIFATHRNEAVREVALFALGEFWQSNYTRSKVMESLDAIPFMFSVLDDPKAPLAFKLQASRAFMFVDSDFMTLLQTHCEKHPLALASIVPLLSDTIVSVRTCCSAQKLAKLRLVGMQGEAPMELGMYALDFVHLALANVPAETLRTHPMFAPLREPATGVAQRLVKLGAGKQHFHQRCLMISREWMRVVQVGTAFAVPSADAVPFHAPQLLNLNIEANVLKSAHCGREDAKLSKCSRCECVRYCGAACQRAHWKAHKTVCVPKPE